MQQLESTGCEGSKGVESAVTAAFLQNPRLPSSIQEWFILCWSRGTQSKSSPLPALFLVHLFETSIYKTVRVLVVVVLSAHMAFQVKANM